MNMQAAGVSNRNTAQRSEVANIRAIIPRAPGKAPAAGRRAQPGKLPAPRRDARERNALGRVALKGRRSCDHLNFYGLRETPPVRLCSQVGSMLDVSVSCRGKPTRIFARSKKNRNAILENKMLALSIEAVLAVPQ